MTSLNPKECTRGWCYMAMQLLVLPSALSALAAMVGWGSAGVNFSYHLVNAAAMLLLFSRFLRANAGAFIRNFKTVCILVPVGLAAYYLAGEAMAALAEWCCPGFSNANDGAVLALLEENRWLTAFACVFLAPVSEECLFRGVVFDTARPCGRGAALAISAVGFSALHVMGFLGRCPALQMALCFLQYLPAGLIFAWVRERSGSILTPMLIHAIINLVATLSVFRAI